MTAPIILLLNIVFHLYLWAQNNLSPLSPLAFSMNIYAKKLEIPIHSIYNIKIPILTS
jgi:uncharacterized protein Usg